MKKTIKKAERYFTKSKTKVVTKTTKVKKKEAPKATFTKHIIKAKVLGKNLVMWVGTTKFTKPNIQDRELKSIENKIKIYNKIPTKARQAEILKFFESVSKKAEDLKKTKAKGLKNVLKHVKKSNPKKTKEEVKDTLDKVIKDAKLEDVLKVVESVQQHKEQPKQESHVGTTRRGEY